MRGLLLLAVLSGCGARTGLDALAEDATVESDATTDAGDAAEAPSDATRDVVVIDAPIVSVSCDAGYFIEVTSDAGTIMFRHGSSNEGLPWGTWLGWGEDCQNPGVEGDGDAGYIEVVREGCGGVGWLPLGPTQAGGRLEIGSVYAYGGGTIDILDINDAAVTGFYNLAFDQFDDGGWTPLATFHGTFCVLPPPP